jgi:uncharacterized protein (UPF0332 family)
MFYATLALLQERSSVPSKHSGVITLFDVEFIKAGLLLEPGCCWSFPSLQEH